MIPSGLLNLIISHIKPYHSTKLIKVSRRCKIFVEKNIKSQPLKEAIKNKNYLHLISKNIHKNHSSYAAENGDLTLLKWIVKKGFIDWEEVFLGTCYGGNIKIVKFLIEKGVNNWNIGLCWACEGGHMEIVKFLIEKGANNWNFGLLEACFGGHMEIVKLMIEKGADDWNFGLWRACWSGHMKIVKFNIGIYFFFL